MSKSTWKRLFCVGEHPDILEAIQKELQVIAQYHDEIEVLENILRGINENIRED